MSSIVTSQPETATAAEPPSADVHERVLLTLAYSDLFDYPLTRDELHHFLVTTPTPRTAVDAAVDALIPDAIHDVDGHLCLRGRADIVDCRRRRSARAAGRWQHAERFARRLARVPFLRMVAVCGSQAVDNPGADGDIDLFLVTAPERLWLAQAMTMVLRRLTPGADFCPNYLITEANLAVEAHNLYTAREIAQTVPLWGASTYQRFLDANAWVTRFLPHRPSRGRTTRLIERPPSRVRRWGEWLLGGTIGGGLDRLVHRLLIVYYTLRLRGRGWTRDDVRAAYRRDRQLVITGGYFGAVATRFTDRARVVLDDEPDGPSVDERIAACFYGSAQADAPARAEGLYAEQFDTRYGAAHG